MLARSRQIFLTLLSTLSLAFYLDIQSLNCFEV